jgi:type II secretory pathway predicted ATPase ExeA
VLRDDRLRLLQAAPEIGDAGVLLLIDEAEEFQPDGMTHSLELLSERNDNFVLAGLIVARHG